MKTPNKRISFGSWLEFWFDTYKKPVLKPYSLRNIEQVLRLHTPAWLKSMPLCKITVFDIDKALSVLPISRTYIYVRQVWHSAFFKACRAGLLENNPVDLCERVRYQKKVSKPLTLEEQRDFIERLEHSRYKWLMLFYLHTGVRRSEALTLEWSDISLKEGLFLIRGTKTDNSTRLLFLTDDIKVLLREQKRQNKKYGKDGSRVFPFHRETVSRAFSKLCPGHHLHELRHTFTTRCCESGVNIKVCQNLLGHSSPAMTMNVYTHVLDDFKRTEAAKFCLFPGEKK